MDPEISVIIPTHNREKQLRQCLNSLFNQSYNGKYEIIVVDDGSTDGTLAFLKKINNKKIAYYSQKNKGPASARNLGVKHSKGRIIAFTDDDCVADKNWVKNIVESHKKNKAKVIGGKTEVNGNFFAKVDKASQDFWFNTIHSQQDLNFWRFVKLALKPYSKSRFVNFLPSNNVSFKRNVFEKFNETYKMPGGEDLELCWELFNKGYNLYYDPRVKIEHVFDLSFKSFLKKYFNYGTGLGKFKKKHSAYKFNTPSGFFNFIKFFLEPFFIPFFVVLHVRCFNKILFLPFLFSQEVSLRLGFIISYYKK